MDCQQFADVHDSVSKRCCGDGWDLNRRSSSEGVHRLQTGHPVDILSASLLSPNRSNGVLLRGTLADPPAIGAHSDARLPVARLARFRPMSAKNPNGELPSGLVSGEYVPLAVGEFKNAYAT